MLTTAFASTASPIRVVTEPAPFVKGPDALSSLFEASPVRAYLAKEHLFCDGDEATHAYRVESGHVCLYRMMPDGRRQVIDFAYPGDVIGLGSLGEHGANAQAINKTRVRCIPFTKLREIARRDPGVGLSLYEAASRELQAARELLFTISQRTAAERVAAFLVALSSRNARRGEDPLALILPMTRTDIADFLGLTIETVSRTFSKFRAEGVIDLEQSIHVEVCDPVGLADIAEGVPRLEH